MKFPKKAIKEKEPPVVLRTDGPYLQHLHRLAEIGKMIDNNPPTLHIDTWLKAEALKQDLVRVKEISRDNKVLLTRINAIMRSTGCTDNYNPLSGTIHSKLGKKTEELESIDKANKQLYKRICRTKARISNVYLEQCWQEHLEAMRFKAKYSLILPGIRPPSTHIDSSSECLNKFRPKAYFEFAHPTGRVLGRITVVLYSDITPITVRNFMELIKNQSRHQKDTSGTDLQAFPHYIGSKVYRIFKGLFVELGDNTKNNGCGGASSFGLDFPQENFEVEANYPGMLAMVPDASGMVNSKFLITVKPLKVINGKRVIFGRVIKGLKCIDLIEKSAMANGKPEEPILITKCNLIPQPNKIKK